MHTVNLTAAIVLGALVAGCGGGGGGSSNAQDSTQASSNQAPTAVATTTLPDAYSSQTITLDAIGSSDSDGSIESYRWTLISGPAFDIVDAQAAQAHFTVPPLAASVNAVIELVVTDDDGATGSARLTIMLGPAPIELSTLVADGAVFTVDDASVKLVVASATLDGNPVSPADLTWESNIDGLVAEGIEIADEVDVALTSGNHTLTIRGDFGALGFAERTSSLLVLPRMLPISPYLDTPAAGHTEPMPVVLVTHVPTQDGVTLDLAEANYAYRPPEWSNNEIAGVLDYVDLIATRQKFILEEMSRFRGYKTPQNVPYLGYRVMAHYVFYEALPLDQRTNPFNPNQRMVDFFELMNRIDGQAWVDTYGVKEFWFNNYYRDSIMVWESNMSSPTTGDVSNSDQFAGDLPVFSRTYIAYGTNYHRTQAEAVHNHGHQIERMLDYVDRRYSGTSELFWGAFVGVPGFPGPPMVPGRCGWTHQPPNTTLDYGYHDQTLVEVDCEDWRPDGTGDRVQVNSAYFDALAYQWPDGRNNIPQRAETHFYIWWGQNMPGDGNVIPYNSTTMENWWRIVGDWDAAITDQIRLYR